MSDDVTKARMVPCPVCKVGTNRRCVDIAKGGPDGGGPEVDGVHQPRIYRAYVVAEADAHNRAVELAAELERLRTGLAVDRWLVWSNQRGMWWRPDQRGYTQFVEEAGRYTRGEAEDIVKTATCDGRLQHHRTDQVTGVEYVSLDEVIVFAPESIEVPW